ncbi:MAG: amino acid ABC transporter ATP-binding protein [Bacilli bacterium]|nr:amino acid ABC transporter ATP-binding protein [Bacilli bacterium]
MIKINDLRKSFENLEVLKGIDLETKQGEVVSIIGPSGSGKSTLLRSINLLEVPSSGKVSYKNNLIFDEKIILNENELNSYRQKVGMVFQNFNIFNNLSVIDNITLALTINKKISKEEANNIASDLLKKIGLFDKANSRASDLSGGQKQRLAIIRATALKPELMLFDEPTSALDPEMVKEVLDLIREIVQAGMSAIIVTHEMAFAKDISDRIIFMDEGKIIETGTPLEIFNNPVSPRLKEFLSKIL